MDRELLARFGREPLALALEHVARFPRRGQNEEPKVRAQAALKASVAPRAGVDFDKCEFVWNRFSCGYLRTPDGLAIVPIWGDLGPVRRFWSWVYYEDLAGVAADLVKDGDVKAALFHIDSPGGYVTGLSECCAAIEAAAAQKPMAAYADDYATSAAYWVGVATGRLSAPSTGIVESIGSLCVHEEISEMLDEAGVTVSVIRSAARKAESNPFEPLSMVARQQLQNEVKVCGDDFVAAVARIRKLDPTAVHATQAACAIAADAVAGGFADAVETFDQACAALIARATPPQLSTPNFTARAAKAARARLTARLSARLAS